MLTVEEKREVKCYEEQMASFIKDLKLVAKHFKWSQDETCGCIRGLDEDDRSHCPMSAVVYGCYGLECGVKDMEKMCRILNLDRHIAADIIAAADNIWNRADTDDIKDRIRGAVGL